MSYFILASIILTGSCNSPNTEANGRSRGYPALSGQNHSLLRNLVSVSVFNAGYVWPDFKAAYCMKYITKPANFITALTFSRKSSSVELTADAVCPRTRCQGLRQAAHGPSLSVADQQLQGIYFFQGISTKPPHPGDEVA